jgi:DNA repair protein RadC
MVLTKKKQKVTSPEKVANIMQSILNTEHEIDQNKEHFWAIGVNNKNVVQYIELVSLGTINESIVHPREVFRLAIMKGVASIIVVHNHPSGELEPSIDDTKTTKRLVDGGDLLGIQVLDHIIITKDSFLSLKQEGYI